MYAETCVSDVEFLNSDSSALPFSEAVRVGQTLYLSGPVGLDNRTGKLAVGGIKGEANQTLKNIKRVFPAHA